MPIKTAIILAGGKGERLRPLTEATPKPLLPIKGKPIIQHVMENMKTHGITNIILALSYHAEKVIEYFKDGKELGLSIKYSIEKEPLGTGGAVKQAAKDLNEQFVLSWGDNLTDIDFSNLIKTHEKNNSTITMAITPREDVENFGVVKLEGNKVIDFVEKPPRDQAPSNFINAGVFIINPYILKPLPEGKFSIEKDCFEKIAPSKKIVFYKHLGQWLPTDTLEKYLKAEKEFIPPNHS